LGKPQEEPSAGKPPARICEGDAEWLNYSTTTNLRTNPSVEINVVGVFARRGFRFKANAEVITEGPRLEPAITFYCSLGAKSQTKANAGSMP
jgi:hypothetical protein